MLPLFDNSSTQECHTTVQFQVSDRHKVHGPGDTATQLLLSKHGAAPKVLTPSLQHAVVLRTGTKLMSGMKWMILFKIFTSSDKF